MRQTNDAKENFRQIPITFQNFQRSSLTVFRGVISCILYLDPVAKSHEENRGIERGVEARTFGRIVRSSMVLWLKVCPVRDARGME